MTEPSAMQHALETDATADQEVKAEVIPDLDVTGDDADSIAAGKVPYLQVNMQQVMTS